MAYERQERGGADAYCSYYSAMDAAMRQKVALTTQYFPTSGRVADMGSGSGKGTYDLARLYGGLSLVGVDISPQSVDYARKNYRLPNLEFIAGDVADPVFEKGSLDGILNSSVLHHVTSFNGYSLARLETCMDNQAESLAEGGSLIIRDFLVPDGPDEVYLDVRADDGAPLGGAPASGFESFSTADLFRAFCAKFRSSQNLSGPVPYADAGPVGGGWARFRCSLRAAQEFLLRKDYRADWEAEMNEEYCYWNLEQFRQAFRKRCLRTVSLVPFVNPWIVANRYEGKARIWSLDGSPLPYPATNVVAVAEKVARGVGVALSVEPAEKVQSPRFLKRASYRDVVDGKVLDLAERPGMTVDVLPWFRRDGGVFVLAKKGFPRPVLRAGSPDFTGAQWTGYVTEPLAGIAPARDPSQARRILLERGCVPADGVLEVGEPSRLFPSPGGLDEMVTSYPVRVEPPASPLAVPAYSGFSTSGTVRELDARQLVRSGHVGGSSDARLETACYRLLLSLDEPFGPWIGADFSGASPQVPPPFSQDAIRPSFPGRFVPSQTPAGYLDVRRSVFREADAEGETVASGELEYVLPHGASDSTVVALPYVRGDDGAWYVGVEHRALPAVQRLAGDAGLAAAPAWRLPPGVRDADEAADFVRAGLSRSFGVKAKGVLPLGGAYFPTPGATPERVIPYAAEVALPAGPSLKWYPLARAVREEILDGHLAICAYRLAHAVGVLDAKE